VWRSARCSICCNGGNTRIIHSAARSRGRSPGAIPALVPGGARERPPLPERDGGRDGNCGWSSIRADGPLTGSRRAGVRLLHQSGEPERSRAGRKPPGSLAFLLGTVGAASADRGSGRAGYERGSGRVLRDAPQGESDQCLGLAAKRADRLAGRTGATACGVRRAFRLGACSPTSLLGRLSRGAGRIRVLAGTSGPAARPVPLRAQCRWDLGDYPVAAVR
jgi:hypothetical protein